MASKLQLRGDTAANWTSVNPTLSFKEPGYETDTGKIKIGDGTTAWSSLAYSSFLSASASFSGIVTFAGIKETRVAMAANDINVASGTFFTKTISTTATLTVSNVPASGLVGCFTLELTNGGSSTVTWWSGVKWASGNAPTLTSAGVDILGFYTLDGGTTWRGSVIAKDSK